MRTLLERTLLRAEEHGLLLTPRTAELARLLERPGHWEVRLRPRFVGAPADPLMEEAKRLAQEYRHLSTSFLQRRLRIGYPRAAHLMEELQQAGLAEETSPETEKP